MPGPNAHGAPLTAEVDARLSAVCGINRPGGTGRPSAEACAVATTIVDRLHL